MKQKQKEAPETFTEIRDAMRQVDEARDEAVLRGEHENPGPRFHKEFDSLVLAIFVASTQATAPALRRLVDVCREIQKLIGMRREIINADRSFGAFWWRQVDLLKMAIDGLERIPRPPQIESPLQIAKGLNKPGDPPDKWRNHIHNVWPDVPGVQLGNILAETEPDLDPATHPDVLAWHREQQTRPLVDMSVLIGAAAEIQHVRERHGAAAVV